MCLEKIENSFNHESNLDEMNLSIMSNNVVTKSGTTHSLFESGVSNFGGTSITNKHHHTKNNKHSSMHRNQLLPTGLIGTGYNIANNFIFYF